MSVYLDTSVAVSLFVEDAHTPRARRLIAGGGLWIVSDLASVEFSSALAIVHRTGRLSTAEASAAFVRFDDWRRADCEDAHVESSDILLAQQIIRGLEHALRAADALHIVLARRLGATLATFDGTMGREASRLGVSVVDA
ncbi:type II toxin-antitoxin system VapC family toxin [Phenylobacterium sp.]|uniref:type II toxin-antitoxin system VapC family toxin n=1 Tax=Phenylobacterium sp. TaxID=1871053 RepID=UPI0025CC68EB|nr:type II toxin-antitoxin system VapC family toxin [Phenylobacterium sp.]MBX3483259.1 type II toxin-antitoxin system VapC family toxin [Phenylobacterium sp.]MCW5759023.1 type II toxin-antitoxin system VapC family toxin [Phenylobacterium sp.]